MGDTKGYSPWQRVGWLPGDTQLTRFANLGAFQRPKASGPALKGVASRNAMKSRESRQRVHGLDGYCGMGVKREKPRDF